MNAPGYTAALADNPDCADLLAALAADPCRSVPSVEPAVRAALRRRARLAARLRAGSGALAAAAAVAAVVRFAPAPAPTLAPTLAPAAVSAAPARPAPRAAWLRAHQNADGSFGAAPADSAAGAWNLALGATALMRLYATGARPDLFTPIDGAVAALRDRLARPAAGAADLQLASALALADSLEWPDAPSGDLHRAMRRLGTEGASFAERRDALARLAGRI